MSNAWKRATRWAYPSISIGRGGCVIGGVALVTGLAGCGMMGSSNGGSVLPSFSSPQYVHAPAKSSKLLVGKPYQIAGKWYVPRHQPNYSEVGLASWYGGKFHGRLTANGETYDANKLSAAHKTLPLNQKVRVTNLENGRSVILRINDRGPVVSGRIIDLSKGAAQVLGVEKKGVVRVRVETLGKSGWRIFG